MVGPTKNEEPRRQIEEALEEIGEPAVLGEIAKRTNMNRRQAQHYVLDMTKDDRIKIVGKEGSSHLYALP